MKIDEDELETDLNKIKENQIEGIKESNYEIINKMRPNDFLKMTMNLLNNQDNIVPFLISIFHLLYIFMSNLFFLLNIIYT